MSKLFYSAISAAAVNGPFLNDFDEIDGYETDTDEVDVETETDCAAELTFYTCYDNIDQHPTFRSYSDENIWNSSLLLREQTTTHTKTNDSRSQRGLESKDYDSENNDKENLDWTTCNVNSVFDGSHDDSPLPLLDRLSRKHSQGQENVCKTPSTFDRRFTKMRNSLVSSNCKNYYNIDGERRGKPYAGLDESIDPVFSSTQLLVPKNDSNVGVKLENLNDISEVGHQQTVSSRLGHNNSSKLIEDFDVESLGTKTKSKSDLEEVLINNVKEIEAKRSTKSNKQLFGAKSDQNKRVVSSTDSEEADAALEALFARVRTPARVYHQYRGVGVTTNITNTTERRKAKKSTPRSTQKSKDDEKLRTKSETSLVNERKPILKETKDGESKKSCRSFRRCNASASDAEDNIDIDRLLRLSDKVSSESEEAKELDSMMGTFHFTPKVNARNHRPNLIKDADDELWKGLQELDLKDNEVTTPKPSSTRKKPEPRTESTRKTSTKCWFLKLDKIEPDMYRDYVRDFHTMSKHQFLRNREKQTRMLFNVYNDAIFSRMFCTEAFQIDWNKNLTSCAGRTNNVSKKTIVTSPGGTKTTKECERFSTIELAIKILDSPDRLRDTLVHEMCHAAVWIETGDRSAGHGPQWKKWAFAVNTIFEFLPLVTRCHNYSINYKFTYQCVDCKAKIGRFSKSINPKTQVCGGCHGKLELL